MKVFTFFLWVWILLCMACTTPDFFDSSTAAVRDGRPRAQMVTRLFLSDSFERKKIPNPGGGFGWRGFIWDWGDNVIGSEGRDVAAVIMGGGGLGPAADLNKALYFYGREGYSVHKIYLLTHTYDLSRFQNLRVAFKYLPFDLNDGGDVKDGVKEWFRFQVCNGTAKACGVGKKLNPDKLTKGPWSTVFEHDPLTNNNGLNGRNHNLGHWQSAELNLDLTAFNRSTGFTFRFVAKMRDGFVDNNPKGKLMDGLALDLVQVEADAWVDPDDGDPTNDDPDDVPMDPPPYGGVGI